MLSKKEGWVSKILYQLSHKLNELTTSDKYPLPRIDDVLDTLSKGCYFSVIDLKAGYWQIPMRKEDAEKIAFRTVDGLHQFTVMPFGLKNAPCHIPANDGHGLQRDEVEGAYGIYGRHCDL